MKSIDEYHQRLGIFHRLLEHDLFLGQEIILRACDDHQIRILWIFAKLTELDLFHDKTLRLKLRFSKAQTDRFLAGDVRLAVTRKKVDDVILVLHDPY